mgnify:CR=1 FL=1
MSGAKNNRMNTDFGIAFFIAGSCHTPDGAYAQLLDLKEDRAMALSQVRAGKYRVASKIALYNHMIANGAEWEKLEAQAALDVMSNIGLQEVIYQSLKSYLDEK